MPTQESTETPLAEAMARLFAGYGRSAPACIGFVYSPSPDAAFPAPSSSQDLEVSGFNVYKAPIAKTGQTNGGSIEFHAVTAGSDKPADYMFAPGGTLGCAGYLSSVATAYVYGVVLLDHDDNVLAWKDLGAASGDPRMRTQGYDMSVTWKVTFV